jgi:cysteine desulfurase / selenocysteine lyase
MNQAIRELFPITEHTIYLNHAAVSPPPTPTVEAIKSQIDDLCQNGSLNYRSWMATKNRARKNAAAMLNAKADEIAFIQNTSHGLSMIANGIEWKPGDNIVTFKGEFPSNLYPWLRINQEYGVEVRMCEEHNGRIDIDELIDLIDSHTKVVTISLVQYASGFRIDLNRVGTIARKHNALLVVDIIQAMGVIPIDVEKDLIDAAACSCHKWLLTPQGLGLLYLSDRAREHIRPTIVGWASVPNEDDFINTSQNWKDSTLAWEAGTLPLPLIYGLDASLKLLLDTGVDRISEYLLDLTDYLCESLKERGNFELVSSRVGEERSQIVSIKHKDGWTPIQLYSDLKDYNIIVSPRGDRLRISPHFYNTKEEIDQLISLLPD